MAVEAVKLAADRVAHRLHDARVLGEQRHLIVCSRLVAVFAVRLGPPVVGVDDQRLAALEQQRVDGGAVIQRAAGLRLMVGVQPLRCARRAARTG